VRFYSLALVAVLTLIGGASFDVRAEGVQETGIYDSFMMDGALHRFDKRNGKLQKMTRSPNGLQWVEVQVTEAQTTTLQPTVQPLDPSRYIPESVRDQQPQQGNSASIGVGPRRGGAPVIDDDEAPQAAKPATDEITPEIRRENLATIASYENKVMPSHAIQIGERMKGNIFMKNAGDRRIKVLELTMFVHVKGLEKPEEYHIVFANKPGFIAPPQPGANGRESSALLYKVDMPAPSGEVKGPPDVKITYLQFE
jgi:hypothetical protein